MSHHFTENGTSLSYVNYGPYNQENICRRFRYKRSFPKVRLSSTLFEDSSLYSSWPFASFPYTYKRIFISLHLYLSASTSILSVLIIFHFISEAVLHYFSYCSDYPLLLSICFLFRFFYFIFFFICYLLSQLSWSKILVINRTEIILFCMLFDTAALQGKFNSPAFPVKAVYNSELQ